MSCRVRDGRDGAVRVGELDVVRCLPRHLEQLAPRLRQLDYQELEAARGFDMQPLEVLLDAWRISAVTYAAELAGQAIACWGVHPVSVMGGIGVPWLLTSDEITRRPLAAATLARPALGVLLDVYPRLIQWVDARHEPALRFVRWLGFHVEDAQPYGPYGMPFHPVAIGRGGPARV
jgi:hypothetical protein